MKEDHKMFLPKYFTKWAKQRIVKINLTKLLEVARKCPQPKPIKDKIIKLFKNK